MKSLLYSIINPVFSTVKNVSTDIKDLQERQKHPERLIPPRSLRRSGGTIDGYIAGGQGQADRLIEYAGLKQSSHLLDVGCGDGRLASALAEFLKDGTYQSFEVQKQFVDFLSRHITKKYPNFCFVHADLWHSYYNPTGKYKTTDYIFPYADDSFDVVFLNSIFSHFAPNEIEHYLNEIRRVLKNEGVVLATYFIANPESIAMDSRGLSAASLRGALPKLLNFSFENYWTRDNSFKERLIIVDETWLTKSYHASNLEVTQIVYGTWCGRDGKNEAGQDIVVARKLGQ